MANWASEILADLATHDDDLVRMAQENADNLWHPVTGDYVDVGAPCGGHLVGDGVSYDELADLI